MLITENGPDAAGVLKVWIFGDDFHVAALKNSLSHGRFHDIGLQLPLIYLRPNHCHPQSSIHKNLLC